MSLVALGITLGSPDGVAIVPVTTSNLAADIAQAVTDLAVVTTAAATTVTATTTADTAMGTVQTDISNVSTAAATTTTGVSNTLTAYDAAAGSSANNLASLLGANVVYTAGTHQFSGTMTGNATITPTQGAALIALFNTVATDLLAAQSELASTTTYITTLTTDGNTAKADTAAAKTDAAAVSTMAVSADLTAATAIISSANVYIQLDSSVVTTVPALNAAALAALNFVRAGNILPI